MQSYYLDISLVLIHILIVWFNYLTLYGVIFRNVIPFTWHTQVYVCDVFHSLV